MSWKCKPENKPDGCGWAERVVYRSGDQEWWCDACERAGHIPSFRPDGGER